MILVWRGVGILVPIIWFASVLMGHHLTKMVYGPNASKGLSNLLGEWLAASLTLGFALLLRLQPPVVVDVDPGTGQPVIARPDHSFFFIPVIAWPAIFCVLGMIVYFCS